LPAELRNRIYDLALNSSKRIVLTSGVRKTNPRHLAYRVRSKKLKEDKELLTPSILRVNRQIYHEALPVLYNQSLEFQDPKALFYFLSQVGLDAVKSLRCIKISAIAVGKKGDVTQPAFTALVQAANLETFSVGHLVLDQPTCGWLAKYDTYHIPMEAKWFFTAAHVWIEQMEKNKATGGKDWREIIVMDESAKSRSFETRILNPNLGHHGGYEYITLTPCTTGEFCKEIEKLLKK
jgi:hypothetical protein